MYYLMQSSTIKSQTVKSKSPLHISNALQLQRRRVSAHAVADGKQELESRIRPVVELGQTAIRWNVYCDDESHVLKSANV